MTVLEAARQQLTDLETQLSASNPQLYRHLALYLQVLRDGLLNGVQQACFHLATQAYPDRYLELDASQRQVLHRRLRSLVQRATSLLTVEHLAHLASQMAREQHRQRQRRRSRLLEALEQGEPSESLADADESDQPPHGSVHLGLALPIGADFLPTSSFAISSAPQAPSLASDAADTDPGEEGEQDSAMQAMAEAFSEWLEQSPPRASTPWDGGSLPSEPALLMAWIAGFELALSRRLRNLSHALNVELLRLGLSRTLLPVSLLDAVLAGQLDTLEAPANLLRLLLPFGPDTGPARLETMTVLLRPDDLELALPKLRTCRTRIQQHRQEVRRMAQHYRRIQRRVQALEAEQLWLQDINPAQTPPLPPT
ncbi:hypothetical protein [Synechococcus sp. 8F6]|uniref:hypothetical protein n=1 Tax=Synechococcus sp. 8F6 TaxID=2025606 RepID=UPI001E500657|nr:hypothetical protein [Synechococcus sp. 8F6]